jgi:hypothetical protein
MVPEGQGGFVGRRFAESDATGHSYPDSGQSVREEDDDDDE